MSGGGCVSVSGPPMIESKDSTLKDSDGDKPKIAFLSIGASFSVGYVACSSGLDSFTGWLLIAFLVCLGNSSIGQILKLFSR